MTTNSMSGRRAFPLSAFALGMLALSATVAFADGDAVAGKKLFLSHCSVCHKADASGGIKLGDTKSANLDSPGLEDQYHKDDTLIRRAILDGKDEEGGDLDKIMPRWNGKITDVQVADIIAFLKTQKTKD